MVPQPTARAGLPKVRIREINLLRTLPVCIITALAVQAAGERILSAHGEHPFAGMAIAMAITGAVCVMVRLGRMPLLEAADGKKHALMLWLEDRIPLLCGESRRNRS